MEKRTIERNASEFGVTCYSGGKSSAANLLNITSAGCLVRTEEEILAAGGALRLQIAQLTRIEGTVIWSDGPEAGIEFSTPLHQAVVQFIVNRVKPENTVDMALRDRFGRLIVPGQSGAAKL